MRLNIAKVANNSFFNPNFIKERTLTLSFNGNRWLRQMEYDLGSIVKNSVPYAFFTASIASFSAGNNLIGAGLALYPLMSILTRSEALRDENGQVVPRHQDMHPEEAERRQRTAQQKPSV